DLASLVGAALLRKAFPGQGHPDAGEWSVAVAEHTDTNLAGFEHADGVPRAEPCGRRARETGRRPILEQRILLDEELRIGQLLDELHTIRVDPSDVYLARLIGGH